MGGGLKDRRGGEGLCRLLLTRDSGRDRWNGGQCASGATVDCGVGASLLTSLLLLLNPR